jgi:hypothetical protein
MTSKGKLQISLLLIMGLACFAFFFAGNLNAQGLNIIKPNQNISENSSDKKPDTTGANKVKEGPGGVPATPAAETALLTPKVLTSNNKTLADILSENGLTNLGTDSKILIDKSDHTLSIINAGVSLKSYHVEFGDGGMGDKEVEGDHKTPEGTFYVTNKEVMDPADEYLGTRWLGVGYPNTEDAERGIKTGLIDNGTYDEIINALNNGLNPPQDTALGGNIGIHGGGDNEGSSWTWGCVGLKNSDIEDFYDYINVGTPIIIQK